MDMKENTYNNRDRRIKRKTELNVPIIKRASAADDIKHTLRGLEKLKFN